MTKTITLRLPIEVYELFRKCAKSDNRPISNLIETAAVRHLEEGMFVEPEEMDEIRGDAELVRRLKRGSHEAKMRKGRLVG